MVLLGLGEACGLNLHGAASKSGFNISYSKFIHNGMTVLAFKQQWLSCEDVHAIYLR